MVGIREDIYGNCRHLMKDIFYTSLVQLFYNKQNVLLVLLRGLKK